LAVKHIPISKKRYLALESTQKASKGMKKRGKHKNRVVGALNSLRKHLISNLRPK
jgi:hypothetical protein